MEGQNFHPVCGTPPKCCRSLRGWSCLQEVGLHWDDRQKGEGRGLVREPAGAVDMSRHVHGMCAGRRSIDPEQEVHGPDGWGGREQDSAG